MKDAHKRAGDEQKKQLYETLTALMQLPRDRVFTGWQATSTVITVVSICTFAGILCSSVLDHENVIMLYFLGSTYIATRCGLQTCLWACLLSVVAFDFFIVPPLFSLVAADPQFLFTFLIMFVVAAVISVLIKQMQEQHLVLQHSRLLDLTNDGIIEWSIADFSISYFNAGAEKLFGIAKDAALGGSIENLLSGIYPTELSSLLEKIKADGKWEGEINYQNAEGEHIAVFSRWTIANDNSGQPLNVVEFVTDIRDRKEADVRVKEFYSTVSHELRTPLTSIRGGLILLENGIIECDTDDGRELITLARTQADRLMMLINDILDLQKIEAGKFEIFTSEVAIGSIISTVVAELSLMAVAENIELVKNIEADTVISVDSVRITQVVTNLLANAIKFSPPQSTIRIGTELRDERLRVSVIDEGPGIASGQMSKLFGRFQQLESSDSRRYSGTGLGLAISKAIIEQHHGIIGVDSEVGKGSTFWFELQT